MDKNNSRRITRLEYLQHIATVVVVLNDDDEIEMKPTKNCESGDKVWFLEADNTFTYTEIY
jgi:hypothetical protein